MPKSNIKHTKAVRNIDRDISDCRKFTLSVPPTQTLKKRPRHRNLGEGWYFTSERTSTYIKQAGT